MRTPSLNSVFGIWRLKNGVPHVILVPAVPKEFLPPGIDLATDEQLDEILKEVDETKIQNKVPGGGAEGDEDGAACGSREVSEEVGIIMKRRFTPQLLMRELDRRTNHVKEGYSIHRSAFRNKMRTKFKREKDSVLLAPIEVPLDEALEIVFQHDRNKFHYEFLLKLKKHIESRMEKKGKRSPGSVLAA